jgi:hypothetical protein
MGHTAGGDTKVRRRALHRFEVGLVRAGVMERLPRSEAAVTEQVGEHDDLRLRPGSYPARSWKLPGYGQAITHHQVRQQTPAVQSQEGVVRARLDPSAGREPHLEHRLNPAGEYVGHSSLDQLEIVVQCPDGSPVLAPEEQCAQVLPGAGVRAHDPRIGCQTARLMEVAEHQMVGAAHRLPGKLRDRDTGPPTPYQELQGPEDVADLLAASNRHAKPAKLPNL